MTKHPISRLLEVEYSKILFLVPVNMTSFGNTVFEGVVKLRKGHWYESYSSRTGFLQEMDWRQRWTHREHAM